MNHDVSRWIIGWMLALFLVTAIPSRAHHETQSPANAIPGISRDRVINKSTPGQPIDITKFLVKGRTNVVEFYSDYCGACRQMDPKLRALLKKRQDLVRLRVDINRPGVEGIDFDSPVVAQYRLEFTPSYKVYDRNGKLLADGQAAAHQVTQLLQAAGIR